MVDRLDFDRTYDDPVVAAVHENRHRILARFGNDIEAYTAFVGVNPNLCLDLATSIRMR